MLAMVLAGASCGGGGSAQNDGSANTVPGTPVAQCKEVVSTVCKRDRSCGNAPDASADDEAACNAGLDVAFGCDRATTGFGDCLTDVKTVSCASLAQSLPGSCLDPINAIPLSTAQQKCDDLGGVVCQWLAACQRVTPTPNQLATCQAAFFSDFDCLFAIDVSAGYNQCLTDVPNTACAAGADGGVTGPDGGQLTLPACLDTSIVYVN
jgi:hypothetical protein